jgi:acylphosphatase
MIAKHLLITGRVQGVGFRFFVERVARELGLTGWVRNRHDGRVEAVVAGTPEAVQTMIDRARRGPRGAVVTNVKVSEAQGSFERFDILPTE